MSVTSKIGITEGSGKYGATYSVTEDAVSKELQRAVLNTSAGVEIGTVSNPVVISGTVTASISSASVTGNVASAATDSGNPVKIGAVYNSSQPTVTTGQRVDLQADNQGNLKVVQMSSTPGDDEVNNVKKVEQQFQGLKVTADTQIKGAAGFVHTITFSPNDSAPTAGSIIVYDSLAESGTQIFNVTFTTTWFTPFTVTLDMTCSTGIYVGFTTTADVNVTISYR